MVNFGSAQLAAYRGDCVSLNIAVDNIVSRMTAQLIQGMIRYFYRADPAGGFASATPKRGKEWAEGCVITIVVVFKLTWFLNKKKLGVCASGASSN